MPATETLREGRRHWVWVTGPGYYLDEDGTERTWPTMSTRFWNSPAATWRLARFAAMALGVFLALQWIVDAWIATVVGVVVATLLLIDEVLSRRVLARRAGITDQSSGASP